jgi:hypothetical protein
MRQLTFSNIFGIIAAGGSVAGILAGLLETISPKYAFLLLAVSAGIQAFTGRVQGVKFDQ